MEKVAIKKTKLLLSLDVDVGDFNVEAGYNFSSCGFMVTEDMCTIMDNLPKCEERLSEDTRMALIYIAGYIVRKDYIEDTFKYHQKYGAFVNDLNRGGLTIPGDSACQWSFYCYVMFREVANYTCRKSLCNILMIISECYWFNMERKHGMIMPNILFNNHSHLYTPRSSKDILFNNHSHLYTPRSSKDILFNNHSHLYTPRSSKDILFNNHSHLYTPRSSKDILFNNHSHLYTPRSSKDILFNNHSHLYTPRSSKDILFNNHSHLYTPRSSKDILFNNHSHLYTPRSSKDILFNNHSHLYTPRSSI